MNWTRHKLISICEGIIVGECIEHRADKCLCKLSPKYEGWKHKELSLKLGYVKDTQYWWFDEKDVRPVNYLMDTE